MEVAVQPLTGEDFQIVRIVCDLVGIHDGAGNLDRAHEVEVVVAQVICELFNLALIHQSRVFDDEVVHGQSSRNRRFVGNHVEIKGAIAICGSMLNKTGIHDSSWGRVSVSVTLFLNQSRVDSLVDEAVQDLRVVVLHEVSNGLLDCGLFIADHFFLVTRATDSISVDRDLIGQALVTEVVILESLTHEIGYD